MAAASQNESIGVAVVGHGFGAIHVAAFRRDPRCRVLALCGRRPEKVRENAERLEIPRQSVDYRELLAMPDVDVISLAVPAASQVEIGRAALAAGKHVFFEKPLAHTLDGAAELAALAAKHRRVTAVNFEFAEIPGWQRAKELIGEGRLGPLRHVTVQWRVENYANKVRLGGWKSESSGGGALNLFASHSFYYLEWLLGPLTTLSAALERAPGDTREGDTFNAIFMRAANGLPVLLSIASDAFLGSGHRIEIYGDAGTLVLENRGADYCAGFQLFLAERGASELREVETADVRNSPTDDGRIGATAGVVRHMIDAIASGQPSTGPSIEHGLRVQRLMDASRRSAHERREFAITEPSQE